MGFRERLEALINECSMENDSNTPDFILAEYLSSCLLAFNIATNRRDSWYGCQHRPGQDTVRISSGEVDVLAAAQMWRKAETRKEVEVAEKALNDAWEAYERKNTPPQEGK